MKLTPLHFSTGWACVAVLLAFAAIASAQTTLTWNGGSTAAAGANASAATNWFPSAAPAADNDYHFVFDLANLTNTATNRTTMTWNVANVGLLSLEFTGGSVPPVNSPNTNFTWGGTRDINLKGGITVNSGDHIFNTTATVVSNATWNIAAGSSLSRATTDTLSMAADRKITKTGAGTLIFQSSNAGILGTLEVQEGVLRVRTGANTLGSSTLALNGGVFEIFSNGVLTNANATTTVIGESTVRLARDGAGAGQSHVMGALQLGSSKLTVTANELNTNGTANVTFGNTTLSNNATLEVVNNIAGATTRLTLGAVGETGGARGLTKTGDGELLLSAANTYSGSTVVSAGSLIIGAAGSVGSSVLEVASGATLDVSAVTVGFAVGSGQTLRGSGTIVGNTTIGSGGILSPGNSTGTLAFNDNLTLDLNSTSIFQINGFGAGQFDLVQGRGNDQTVGFGGTLNLTFINDFSTTGSVKIFDFESYSGSFTNFSSTGLADGYSATFDSLNGTVNVVPEPSTYALLVLAAAGLGARVIRRRRR